MLKKLLYPTLALAALLTAPTTALAQDDWTDDDDEEEVSFSQVKTGFYRFINNGYGDVLNVTEPYGLSINETEGSALSKPGTIFYYDTNGMYSIADDMAQLMDENGEIDGGLLQNLFNSVAWKSGSYTTYDLTSQGVSYGYYLRQLNRYFMQALDNFPESEEVEKFRTEGPVWFLAVSSFLYPSNYDTKEHFQEWVRNYLDQWKPYFDVNIYLKPASGIENGFLMHFHTPVQLGDLKSLEQRLASLGYNYDFFGIAKRKALEEAAKELDVNGPAYKFIERILEPLKLNTEYYIGESEDGKLTTVGLSSEAMWGENGELASINQDELLWILQPVDQNNPLQVAAQKNLQDADGYYYTTLFTEFAYQLGEGVEAFYVDGVTGGQAHLTAIEGKVPALTGVLLRSKNSAAVSNRLLPIDENVPAIEGNLLKGTLLNTNESDGKSVLAATANGQIALVKGANSVSANAAYIETPADGADVVVAQLSPDVAAGITAPRSSEAARQHSATSLFDLQGRQISSQPSKGIYVKNGKKYVVK